MTRLDCSEVRDLIHAFADEELPPDERQAVAAHLDGCRACAAALADIQRLRANLAAAGTFSLPAHVEARARAAIGLESRASQPWNRRSVLTLAASHVVIAGLAAGSAALLIKRADDQERATRELVAAHVRATFAEAPVQVASSDQHTVRPWFAGKIDYSPPVRDLSAEGFPLVGGRLDYVLGRPAATLVYGRRKHRVSVFVLPEPSAATAGLAAAARDGFNLAIWKAQGFAFLAVSDLNRGELDLLQELLKASS